MFEPFMKHGLSSFIKATKINITRDLQKYMASFRKIFYKHCTTETEINIKNQNIDDEGWARINILKNEAVILDFNSNLDKILEDWIMAIEGQPQPKRANSIGNLIKKGSF